MLLQPCMRIMPCFHTSGKGAGCQNLDKRTLIYVCFLPEPVTDVTLFTRFPSIPAITTPAAAAVAVLRRFVVFNAADGISNAASDLAADIGTNATAAAAPAPCSPFPPALSTSSALTAPPPYPDAFPSRPPNPAIGCPNPIFWFPNSAFMPRPVIPDKLQGRDGAPVTDCVR